jgi:hypothetical protein
MENNAKFSMYKVGKATSYLLSFFLILTVETAIAFEDRDFDLFCVLLKKLLASSPQDPMKLAGVASVQACKFAVSGDESARNECLQYLEHAEKLAGPIVAVLNFTSSKFFTAWTAAKSSAPNNLRTDILEAIGRKVSPSQRPPPA